MKVLFGWELGGGQGHIQRLVVLARELEIYGVEPVFALKSYNIKATSFPWQIVFAPRLPFTGRSESYTFADILETFGFGNYNLLKSHILAWQAIIKEVKPSLIITDHAPGLVIAAKNIVPTIVTGDAFTVPPPVEIFPNLRIPAPLESQQRQEQVSNTVKQILQYSAPLGQILNGDTSFIFGIPELDPYQHLRSLNQYLSVHVTPIPNNLYKSDGHAWAYLYDDYSHRSLVLNTLKPQCDFQPLTKVLAGKSLAIHHGSSTTAITCLLAGIPQLLLPKHLEHQLNAVSLSGLGVAKTINNPTWETLVAKRAQAYLLVENALLQAEKLAHWNQNFISVFVKACLKFLK
ncbi:hypothetical protein CAL7716_074060 [Calothrix sp. PCC 7716]|nr:hypothetical protein CAL7716_074060 [Calothrix sp. PCC 7716]